MKSKKEASSQFTFLNKISKLMVSMLKIGIIGFGGGNALIPVIKQVAIDDKRYITESEYEEDIVVASITPGALPVELAAGIGKRMAGFKGMFLSASAMAFPGALLAVILVAALSNSSDIILMQIQYMTIGVTAFICCLLSNYIKSAYSGMQLKRDKIISIVVMILVFALTCGKNVYRLLGLEGTLFTLSTIQVFGLAFAIIFVISLLNRKKRDEKQSVHFVRRLIKEIIVILIIAALLVCIAQLIIPNGASFISEGLLSSVMSFGGGDAYLTVADGMFVQSDMITEDEFYGSIVPAVNVLPGSILCKTLTVVGYFIGLRQGGGGIGCLIALLGFVTSVVASSGIFSIVAVIYSKVGQLSFFVAIKKWIKSIVAGLMLSLVLSLIYQNRKLGLSMTESISWSPVLIMIGIFVIDFILMKKTKVNRGVIALGSAATSLLVCYIIGYFGGI